MSRVRCCYLCISSLRDPNVCVWKLCDCESLWYIKSFPSAFLVLLLLLLQLLTFCVRADDWGVKEIYFSGSFIVYALKIKTKNSFGLDFSSFRIQHGIITRAEQEESRFAHNIIVNFLIYFQVLLCFLYRKEINSLKLCEWHVRGIYKRFPFMA